MIKKGPSKEEKLQSKVDEILRSTRKSLKMSENNWSTQNNFFNKRHLSTHRS
jgi:hypothetical protein